MKERERERERERESAALSISLTRLKPRGPPRAGAHQKQGPMQTFRGRRMSRSQRSSKPREREREREREKERVDVKSSTQHIGSYITGVLVYPHPLNRCHITVNKMC